LELGSEKVNPEEYQIDDNLTQYSNNPNVIRILAGDYFPGNCPLMKKLHEATLFKKEDEHFGELTLIYVKNQFGKYELIGSMKMKGDKSILALKTIIDAEGKTTMTSGQVYAATVDTTRMAIKAFASQGKWAKLYLDSIQITYVSQLFSSLVAENISKILSSPPPQL